MTHDAGTVVELVQLGQLGALQLPDIAPRRPREHHTGDHRRRIRLSRNQYVNCARCHQAPSSLRSIRGQARATAARWKVAYVFYCARGLGTIDLDREGPGGVAALLAKGQRRVWLQPLPLKASHAQLYGILPPTRSEP